MKNKYKSVFAFLFLCLFSVSLFAQSDKSRLNDELQSAAEI